MFEDIEFNPMSAAAGVIGGVIALIVMSKVEIGLIYKIGAFIGSTIAGYLVFNHIANKG